MKTSLYFRRSNYKYREAVLVLHVEGFAYDIVLLAESEVEVREGIAGGIKQLIKSTKAVNRSKINKRETKVMERSVNGSRDSLNIKILRNSKQKVDEMNYLGSIVTKD